MAGGDEEKGPFNTLIFYTHNVARALKPSIDGELAHAIHETLHYALDGEPQDYLINRRDDFPCSSSGSNTPNGVVASHPDSTSRSVQDDENDADIHPGFFPTDDDERPYVSYAWEDDSNTLILPHPKTVDNPALIDPCTNASTESGIRDAFDVTAKFFFLNSENRDQYSANWVTEAMRRFTNATGLDTVDTLILAFGDIDKGQHQSIDRISTLWKTLSPNEQILSMGLSDLSQGALKAVVDSLALGDCHKDTQIEKSQDGLQAKSSMTNDVQASLANNASNGLPDSNSQSHVYIPSSPSKAVFTDLPGDEESARKEYGPGPCRRPRLCTINLKPQSSIGDQKNGNSNASMNGTTCWDYSLASYCKDNNILLVAHSDRKDILPSRTLPTLMKEFDGKMPHPLPSGKVLQPLWVFKYTVLIRDRGVLADKGFLLCAQTSDV